MLGKIPAARLALIEKIVASAARTIPKAKRPLAADFMRAFFRGVAEEDLRAHCRRHLTAYKQPKQVEFRDSLPKTAVGKVLRRELRS